MMKLEGKIRKMRMHIASEKYECLAPAGHIQIKPAGGRGEQATNDREDEGKAWNTFIAESPVLQY